MTSQATRHAQPMQTMHRTMIPTPLVARLRLRVFVVRLNQTRLMVRLVPFQVLRIDRCVVAQRTLHAQVLLRVLRLDVAAQCIRLHEPQPARFALVRLVVLVAPFVVAERAWIRRPEWAAFAGQRLQPRMLPDVNLFGSVGMEEI